ncbi:hypothetical protein BJ138DRAFT_1150742 [Hygrophoropsis aurantiaca]|uniref:Uncharacterized protein n=1 Tax=Hygrophoropsis aurantiaca TaxID=72124 RepID=A0ACB8AEV9_9AGAM|nr:hypothetical protein BJ138DRAFT_1150742 [Hygrophoropsis aurantiaca]
MATDGIAESSASGAKSKNKRVTFKLTKDASNHLVEYAKTKTAYPRKDQKLLLLERVQQFPGCGTYTYEQLSAWFGNHRNQLKRIHTLANTHNSEHADASILFPSLTPPILRRLDALLKTRPDPKDAIVSIWASRLGAPFDDVVAWIEYQKALSDPQYDSEQPTSQSPVIQRSHLPTPSKSLSPIITTVNRNMSLPPIAVKLEASALDSPMVSPVSASRYPVHTPSTTLPLRAPMPSSSILDRLDTVEPLRRKRDDGQTKISSVPLVAPTVYPKISLKNSLSNKLRPLVLASGSHGESAPTTVSDFAARYQPYEQKITQVVREAEQGNLDPSRLHPGGTLSMQPMLGS